MSRGAWLFSMLLVLGAAPLSGAGQADEPEFVMVPAVLLDDEAPAALPVIEAGALADYVRGVIATFEREHGLAAMTVSVVHGDQLVLAEGYGLADIEAERPVRPDQTLFRIGSVSKTFTWTAVMMLVERGLVDLDTDVNTYLREVEVREAFGEPVTLRHLMHHRAGFEDVLRLFAVADDDPRTLAELLAEHQPRRVFPPGARTSYSNWGSALAAQLVEDVAGVDYSEFLREEILEPLGMHETTWAAPALMDEAVKARLATGYKHKSGAFDLQGYMQIGAYWPAGGMASTATEMARWMRFHLNGGELDGVRLMSADTHARMWTRGYDDRPEAADLAHGFQDRPYRGVRTLAHAGGTGAYLTNLVLVPELGFGVFLSYNSTHTAAPIRQLPDLVIDHFTDHRWRPVQFQSDEEGAEQLAELAGTYVGNRRTFSTFAAAFALTNTVRVTPVAADALTVTAGGETRYVRRVTGDVFESGDGQRIAFVRDDNGRVVALADSFGVHSAEKVGWWRNPNTFFLVLGLCGFLALTSTLGAWRRYGRGLSGGFASRMAGVGVLAGVLSAAALIGGIIALVLAMAEFDISRMPEMYPPFAMLFTHYAGWAVAGATVLMLLALWPAWSGSGWGVLRRLHFTVFALAMLVLSLLLWQWRVIGAPVI